MAVKFAMLPMYVFCLCVNLGGLETVKVVSSSPRLCHSSFFFNQHFCVLILMFSFT